MPPNQHLSVLINDVTFPARHLINNEPDVLSHIYRDDVNMVVWQRDCQSTLDLCAREWLTHYPSHSPKLFLSMENIGTQLTSMLPPVKYAAALQQDIALLIEMVSCLFECHNLGLRLAPLTSTMCPRFHVDNIPCRLVTTYGGPGTEWLTEDNVNRAALSKRPPSRDDETAFYYDPKMIQRMASQQVALLKGSGWEGNENHGIVHRSPQLLPTEQRLLLTLDF